MSGTSPRIPPRHLVGIMLLALGAGVSSCSGDSAAPSVPRAAPVAPASAATGTLLPMNLPKTLGAWTRGDAPRRIDARMIFDYMDGGGELYLAYRFDHLDVYEYASPDQGTMLVELYWMETSDDAFGLLSNDWGGEQVRPATGTSPIELYGAGLLRVWSGNLYARILAEKETPASRERVLELGRAIAAGRPETPRPALWAALPPSLDAGHALAADRICYLRSHLVLNSVYFLSSGNILDLGRRTEAVIAPYRTPSPPAPGTPPPARPAGVELMIIRYPDRTAARAALSHFVHAFLPESSPALEPNRQQLSGFARVEHGWVGYGLDGRSLVLIFDAPDQSLARQGIARATESLENLERPHE